MYAIEMKLKMDCSLSLSVDGKTASEAIKKALEYYERRIHKTERYDILSIDCKYLRDIS